MEDDLLPVRSGPADSGLRLRLFMDVSGSMTPAGGIPAAIEFYRRLRDSLLSQGSASEEVVIRIVTYHSEAQWTSPREMPVEDIPALNLTAGEFSDFGAALRLAIRETSERSASDGRAEHWIWIGDGHVTDNWRVEAERLRATDEFRMLRRWSVATGEDPDLEALTWFAHDATSMVWATAPEQLFDGLLVSNDESGADAEDAWLSDGF